MAHGLREGGQLSLAKTGGEIPHRKTATMFRYSAQILSFSFLLLALLPLQGNAESFRKKLVFAAMNHSDPKVKELLENGFLDQVVALASEHYAEPKPSADAGTKAELDAIEKACIEWVAKEQRGHYPRVRSIAWEPGQAIAKVQMTYKERPDVFIYSSVRKGFVFVDVASKTVKYWQDDR